MRRWNNRRSICMMLMLPVALATLLTPSMGLKTADEAVSAPGDSQPLRLYTNVFLPELPVEDNVSIPETVKVAEAEPLMAENPETEEVEKVSLGEFTITAYCSCPKCCGKWSGHKMSIPTEDGVPYPMEGYTVSVDPDVIPLKSTIEIEGLGERYAHDTGSAIKGKRIDLFFDNHEDALSFGKKKLDVWILG